MIDLYQAQEDLFEILMSAPQLSTVNVVNERRFIMAAQAEMDAVWQTVRNGCAGNGLLVEEPKVQAHGEYGAAPGPVLIITFPIVCFQNGDAALLDKVGGGFYASRLGAAVMDVFWQLQINGIGLLTLEGDAYARADDFPGINAVRIFPKAKLAPAPANNRCAIVTATMAGNQVTLACATAGAKIVYTLDGSCPSDPAVAINPLTKQPINPAATVYAGPFNAAPGFVRAAAYAGAGDMQSPVQKFTVS